MLNKNSDCDYSFRKLKVRMQQDLTGLNHARLLISKIKNFRREESYLRMIPIRKQLLTLSYLTPSFIRFIAGK